MSNKPMTMMQPPEGYPEWLITLKNKIHYARQQAGRVEAFLWSSFIHRHKIMAITPIPRITVQDKRMTMIFLSVSEFTELENYQNQR